MAGLGSSVSPAGIASPLSSIFSAPQPAAALRGAADSFGGDGSARDVSLLARITEKAGLTTSTVAMTVAIVAATTQGQRRARSWRFCGGSAHHGTKRLHCPTIVFQAPSGEGSSTAARVPTNLYELLGVSLAATPANIKHAYHGKMKLCHPDVVGPDGEEMCMLLNEAYRTLGSAQTRSAYDEDVQATMGEDGFDVAASQDAGEDPGPAAGGAWKWKPRSSSGTKPRWTGKPYSQPLRHTVPVEGRGDMWYQEQYVYVDEWSCIACRNCCDVAPETFSMDEDNGRARVFAQWGNDEEYLDYALASCPVDCIYWVNRKELAVLEHVTREQMYKCGGVLPCPMNAERAGRVNIFAQAARWQERLDAKAKRSARREIYQAAASLSGMQDRIREAYARLPGETRAKGWGGLVG